MRSPSKAGGVLAALLALSSAADARDSSNRLTGIFSNVQHSELSGDLGGLEIEINADAPQPFAVVVHCEGWCNQSHRVPIKVNGNKFELSFAESYHDEAGKLVGTDRYRLRGHLSGQTLIAELQSDQLQAEPWQETHRLKRRKARLGLDVAKAAEAKP